MVPSFVLWLASFLFRSAGEDKSPPLSGCAGHPPAQPDFTAETAGSREGAEEGGSQPGMSITPHFYSLVLTPPLHSVIWCSSVLGRLFLQIHPVVAWVGFFLAAFFFMVWTPSPPPRSMAAHPMNLDLTAWSLFLSSPFSGGGFLEFAWGNAMAASPRP